MEAVFNSIDFDILFKLLILSLIMTLGSFFIIRFGGKKSVSQMTLPEMVVMISMGSLIITPFNRHFTILGILFCVLIFILVMMFLEWLTLKSNFLEKLINSTPTLLIKDGQIMLNNLNKERISIDELHSRLRSKGISSVEDLRTCTLEINGDIGYEENKNYNPKKPNNIFDKIRDKNEKV
jgi:uncharacterized membrane protein YcaP (DUF421 family)